MKRTNMKKTKKNKSRKSREEFEIEKIESEIELLREKLLEKRPEHFSSKDIVTSFFASFIVGLTFVFNGALVERVKNLTDNHVILILFLTIAILTAQIYFIGYSRIKDTKERPFGQFWLKRLITFYFISIITSVFLVYLFAINQFIAPEKVFNLVIALSMPCAVAAAIPNLIRQY
ncbi:MAG TPA: DUF2391 family protein [Candidatus Nanoarchaeia archaeon]|nr:DUF2391 family protein [Candidatus Nanoarchaeia archaeon]